jgi:hypothetical protein
VDWEYFFSTLLEKDGWKRDEDFESLLNHLNHLDPREMANVDVASCPQFGIMG